MKKERQEEIFLCCIDPGAYRTHKSMCPFYVGIRDI